jgi:uncharacterized protein
VLYLDSSALVKLYVREQHSTEVLNLARPAEQCLCHEIGFVEVRAAFAAAERDGRLATEDWKTVVTRFISDWESISRIEVDVALIERAAELAEGFGLRGFDALHLAAADRVKNAVGAGLSFVSFDTRLNRAAKLLGLRLPPFVAASS